MIRSKLPVIRIFLVPYLALLALFILVTGVGSSLLYFKAREAQSELLIHGLLETVTPVLTHISGADIKTEIRDINSRLHQELNGIFKKIPELEHLRMQTPTNGFHKYFANNHQLITRKEQVAPVSRATDLRGSTASKRLYSESDPLLQIQFELTGQRDSIPVHLVLGFNRSTLRDAVSRAMSILRQAIVLFFVLGLVSLAVALWVTVWAAGKARWLEARMQEIYQNAETAELMSGLVHDLRNPLASLRANIASLRITPRESREILAEMDQDLVRLDSKLASILDLTRQQDEEPRPIEVQRLVEEVGRLAEPALESRDIELKSIIRVEEPVILMINAMRDVLLNLVLNAAESGQQGGEVELEVRGTAETIVFEVRDRGMGIPEDTDIFAPFVTSKDSGHGLGLAVSRRTVHACGGTIQGRNRQDGGAVFTVILPVAVQVNTVHS